MGEIANILGFFTGRPVIDRTGLTGAFEVQLQFRPKSSETRLGMHNPTADPDLPSLFTAVREQLGLRLNATRGPVRTTVVDAVQMPGPD